jgi:hypothetical protein
VSCRVTAKNKIKMYRVLIFFVMTFSMVFMILLSYVSYFFCCLRYDKANKKGIANGYFLWLTIGYGVGEHSCRIFFDLNSVAFLAHFLYIVILINESTTQQGNLSPFCFLSHLFIIPNTN